MYSRPTSLTRTLLRSLLACLIAFSAALATPCIGSCETAPEAQSGTALLQISHRTGATSYAVQPNISEEGGVLVEQGLQPAVPDENPAPVEQSLQPTGTEDVTAPVEQGPEPAVSEEGTAPAPVEQGLQPAITEEGAAPVEQGDVTSTVATVANVESFRAEWDKRLTDIEGKLAGYTDQIAEHSEQLGTLEGLKQEVEVLRSIVTQGATKAEDSDSKDAVQQSSPDMEAAPIVDEKNFIVSEQNLTDSATSQQNSTSSENASIISQHSFSASGPDTAPAGFEQHGLHRVVGKDGVLMITMARQPERYNYSSSMLAKAGIYPTMFPGTDGKDVAVSQEALDNACTGCPTRSLQALASSHMRALLAAKERSSDWTAILEDDVIPVLGSKDGVDTTNWNDAFDAAWALLPPEAKFVRLGRCISKTWDGSKNPSQAGVELHTFADAGVFRVVKWIGQSGEYWAGGCNHAYLVHKDVLPAVLALFPCTSVLDYCFQSQLFNNATKVGNRGLDALFNIDTQATPDESWKEAQARGNYPNMMQFGVIQQDWPALPMGSTREAQTEYAAKVAKGIGTHLLMAEKRKRLLSLASTRKGNDWPLKDLFGASSEESALSKVDNTTNSTDGHVTNTTVNVELDSQ